MYQNNFNHIAFFFNFSGAISVISYMVVCGPFEGSEGTANDLGRLRIRLGELLNYFLDWSVRNDQRDDLTARTGKPILKK